MRYRKPDLPPRFVRSLKANRRLLRECVESAERLVQFGHERAERLMGRWGGAAAHRDYKRFERVLATLRREFAAHETTLLQAGHWGGR